MRSTATTATITPAMVPALLLLPVSDPLESFADVESAMPDVEEAAVEEEERPALNGAVVDEDVLDAVVRTDARRVLEEDGDVLDAVVRGTGTAEVVVSSSSSVEVTTEERAVVRRAVVLLSAEVVATLVGLPRTGARLVASSEAVVSGWPVGGLSQKGSQLDCPVIRSLASSPMHHPICRLSLFVACFHASARLLGQRVAFAWRAFLAAGKQSAADKHEGAGR